MKRAKKITKKLLDLMGIEANLEVFEKDETVNININSEDSGLLIGYHGDTLRALQIILGIMINQGSGEWQNIIVDIGDYQSQRQEALKDMVSRAAQRAREFKEEQELPSAPANERRLMHIAASEENGVVSESRGEGRERRVFIKPA